MIPSHWHLEGTILCENVKQKIALCACISKKKGTEMCVSVYWKESNEGGKRRQIYIRMAELFELLKVWIASYV